MFKGSMVALITPMNEDGSIDKEAVRQLVDWHLQSKTDGLIIAGSTGEGMVLDIDEQFDLLSSVVKQVAGKIPVIAGAGTNSTRTTITLAENAKRAGVDACLIVTPYYNKPPQNGLYQHYEAIAKKIAMPIILYNVPGRTACDLLPETVERLSKVNHIVGIKEATGKLDRAKEILERCDKAFELYSGDDATCMEFMLMGGHGVISVTANVAPAKMHDMCEAALKKDRATAEKINKELMLLHERLFIESNPIPTKWALHQMGKIQPGIRLPLISLDNRHHHAVKEALQTAGAL